MKNLCHEDKLEIIRQFATQRGMSPYEISKGSGISLHTAEALMDPSSSVKHQCRVLDSVIDYIERKLTVKQEDSQSDVIRQLRDNLEMQTKLTAVYKSQAAFCSNCSKLYEP